jgi:type I restriction enzyme S subunit
MDKPKIRFKGYTDAWEQRKLIDEVSSVDTGKSKFTPQNEGAYEILGSTSVIGYTDSYDYEGDFLLTARVGVNAGELYRHSGKVKISDNTVFIQGKHLDFIFYTLLNFDIKRLSFGTGQPLVKASELKQQMIYMPMQDTERQKIGSYFSTLDHLITLHQRKCKQTQKLKKFMLQKMFPQNGENVPEIRFDGFADAWEQRKLSEITTSYSGGTPQAGNAEYYNGDIPFIRSGEIYEEHTELFITQKGMNNSSAKMVSKGDILYALYGATSGEVSRAKFVGAINQAILAIIPCESYDADFLVEWFRKEKDNITEKYLQGGQGNLSAQIIKNLEIKLPSFEEQKKIGKYFEKINALITLHQRKCAELQKIKKFMLQNMFV